MAKFSLIGALVTIAGSQSCVESGDIDLGELNLVETTCSSDAVRTWVPGTHNNSSGSVVLNSTDSLDAWLAAYDDGLSEDPPVPPQPVAVIFTWPDTGNATLAVSAVLTNITVPVGVDQAVKTSFKFSGVAGVTFTA